MVKEVDPSDIGKFPNLIKKAQMEMSKTDVHVCGQCHAVFHFVELFLKHRHQGCSEESALRDSKETKPKVWAFLLWKASQLGSEQGTGNAWKQYQNWIKLEDTVRETWIVAGRTIQSFAKMGQGNLHEMPVKITKTVVDTSVESDSVKNVTTKTTPPMKPGIVRQVPPKIVQKKTENMQDNDAAFDSIKNDKLSMEQPKVVKKPITTRSPLAKIPSNPVLLNKGISKLATRTIPNTNETETEERIIEKILAKRFNPRKKEHEYLVKWDNSSHEDNTWEPQSHLKNCAQLLDTFEKQLARQKEQRALMAARQAALQAEQEKPEPVSVPIPALPIESPTRPVRNSKARAMDNVRQWCADNEELASGKRKSDDSDYEQGQDTEDDEMQPPPIKMIKTDNNAAVAQALIKAGQSGNVRIVPVSKGSSITPKENGTGLKSPEKNSADVVITSPKDGKQTGIVKKPGVVITTSAKNEAQVRVVQKGESASSGVVRITSTNAHQTKVVPKQISSNVTTIKGTTNQTSITTKSGVVPKPNVTTRPASASRVFPPGARPASQIGNKPQMRSSSVQQVRSSLSPANSPNALQQKSGVTRIVKKSPMSGSSQTMTHDEKLAALTRHGDLKITRKQMPISQVPQIASIKTRVDDEDYNLTDPFPNTITPVPPSPPRELTLCPVTGKVLSQAEGEPTPQPSPEPEQSTESETSTTKLNLKKEANEQQMDTDSSETQIHQILTNEDGTPVLVTGEDGTIYQVAGKNEQGQTILLAQGSDGEQQFVYVTSEDDEGLMTLDTAVAEAVQQGAIEQATGEESGEQQFVVKQDSGDTDPTQPLAVATDSDSQDGQITAEVIQADLPSPGGTRKVVLLLPDGNFVMTEVSDEQFQSLNLQ